MVTWKTSNGGLACKLFKTWFNLGPLSYGLLLLFMLLLTLDNIFMEVLSYTVQHLVEDGYQRKELLNMKKWWKIPKSHIWEQLRQKGITSIPKVWKQVNWTWRNNHREEQNDSSFKNWYGPAQLPYTLPFRSSEEGLTFRGIPDSISIWKCVFSYVLHLCFLIKMAWFLSRV